MNKFLRRIGIGFYSYIGKDKICDGWSFTILPTLMVCLDKNEFTFIFGWLFWQSDVYYTR